ncbi:MAG: aldo/keto reductase [Tagaea sp.]|nr:aldo/keto reductase [Tagaea sp.]
MSRGGGVELPEIGLGCASLGRAEIAEDVAQATLRAAIEAGIGYFDTAPLYGCGLSERRLGRALTGLRGKRPIISTKVGHVIDAPEGSHLPASHRRIDYSKDAIARSLARSLERLGVDRVDIVYIHDPGRDANGAESAFEALCDLRSQGLFDAIGVGTGSVEAALAVVRRFRIDVVLIAGRLTLLNREAATALLPACAASGTKIVAAGVFNSGILAAGDPATANYDYARAPAPLVAAVRDLARVCDRFGVPLKDAAIRFAARLENVSTTLLGAAGPTELAQCLAAFSRAIPDALWPELDDIARRHAV